MMIDYTPKGVCSKRMQIEVDGGVVTRISIAGGCQGNSQGLCSLVEGMRVEDVIGRLDGIHCGPRKTSCPDQLARALRETAKT